MASPLDVLAAGEASTGPRTLAEKAFETLHEAIITGRLRPGERLPIEELASVLEMSAMPIREAVRRLDSAGLVENIPHRGERVTQLSIADLAEVYEARVALEVLAIRRAAERFDAKREDAARLRLAALEARPDDNSSATSAAHTAFHFALYDAADSAWLLRLIRPVWETSERYCLAVPESRQLAARRHEHEAILAACAAHDPDTAALALHDHLATTANNVSLGMGGEPIFALGATTSPHA
ncbi:MAG TPA: GntR family transcriptional regulator [Solirubrobacteraceae bacterium]|nr:GntR family transcriptional regulator [Solirubrobacteraceae bacterium]